MLSGPDRCCTPTTCPQVLIEVNLSERRSTGSVIVVGENVTHLENSLLSPGSVDDDELVVRLPFSLIHDAVHTYWQSFDSEGRIREGVETDILDTIDPES